MEKRSDEVPVATTPLVSAAAGLAEAVKGSRALGSRSDFVLHGGGNSSIKIRIIDATRKPVDVLYVKGSGSDLGTIDTNGFAGMRLDRLRELLLVDSISDAEMVNELRCAVIDADAPDPSVETLLHALIPYRAVLHSHADAIAAITNQPNPERLARDVFGEDLLVVPYVMPGFALARDARKLWAERSTTTMRAMLLLQHGLVTFGDTMDEALETHLKLIDRAAEHFASAGACWPVADGDTSRRALADPLDGSRLRQAVSAAAGRPMILSHLDSARVRRYMAQEGFPDIALRGPATPDHSIHTKRTPLIGLDVVRYAEQYRQYFARNMERVRHNTGRELTMLDPAPRVVLSESLGLFTAGRTAADADVVREIALHTMDVVEAAEALGRYNPITEPDLFDVEYWDLEQAKLQHGDERPLAGQVALVTGAASGIGARCAEELMGHGAAVVGLDIAPAVTAAFASPSWLGLQTDVTDRSAVSAAIAAGVERFGGIDIIVVAAGIFAQSAALNAIDPADWQKTFDVNVTSVMSLFSLVQPYLALSPTNARVTVIGSKNVAAPGPGAAAYSASKAAVTQLARVAALEWAPYGIRVNVVHPDAVFDTGLWTETLLHERAAKYGLTVDEYKRRNLLSTSVTARNVADMVLAMCLEPFATTTGAQVPVDGGNERVL